MRWLFMFCSGVFAMHAHTQPVMHNTSTMDMNAAKYLRLHYDNDFFTNTDHYYTQGITIEYADPFFKKFIASPLLIKLPGSVPVYGASFDLFGFTPTSISSDSILYGDRPFAGAMSSGFFSSSLNQSKNLRLVSTIRVGVIGPAALGEQIQTSIHRWTGNKLPRGWQHQVKNDLLLNYQLNVEKRLLTTKVFTLNGTGEIRAGTLHNRIGTGINIMAGKFHDPFRSTGIRKTGLYFFGQTQVNLVGYDAMMQGGIFNRNSPYTIASRDISRVTCHLSAGIVLKLKKLQFQYSQSYITKEFRTGRDHRWGGVSAGITF